MLVFCLILITTCYRHHEKGVLAWTMSRIWTEWDNATLLYLFIERKHDVATIVFPRQLLMYLNTGNGYQYKYRKRWTFSVGERNMFENQAIYWKNVGKHIIVWTHMAIVLCQNASSRCLFYVVIKMKQKTTLFYILFTFCRFFSTRPVACFN